MKKILFSSITILMGMFANAQCPFDPIIAPATLELCPNSNGSLSTQIADSYQWYKNGNPIIGANSSFLAVSQAADAGSSFVVVSTLNGCSEPSPAVSVLNAAFPPISISIVDDLSASACAGDTRLLTVNDPFNINIRWFRDGVQLIGQTNDTIVALQAGSYSAIAFSDVCPSNSQNSGITAVSYIAAPTPTITFLPSNLTLNTTVADADIQWLIDGNPISGETGQTFLPSQNGEVTVQATYAGACVRVSSPYSYNSFVLDCEHNPVITPNNLVLCPNTSDTLFSFTGDSYRWFKDGSELLGQIDSFLVINSTSDAGSQISVEVSLNGCAELSPEVLVDGWVFLPITVSTEGLSQGSLCEGDSLLLQVNQPFTEDIRWFKNGDLISSATTNSIIVTTTGTYTVTAATSICPLYEETSLNLDYTFLANPQPVISYFAVSNTMACDVIASDYLWYANAELLSGINTQIITPDIAGDYTVQVNYVNGCSTKSAPLTFDPSVGLEFLNKQSLNIYPNPTIGNVYFTAEESGQIDVFDISGALVYSQKVSKGKVMMDLSELNSGVYSMRFTSSLISGNAFLIKN